MFFRQLKTIRVKPVHVPQILEAADKRTKAENSNYVAHFELWDMIEKLYPETTEGHWQIKQHGSEVFLVQTAFKCDLRKI
jgi:hypothetical protein